MNMTEAEKTVAVVGGGAAGLMAAAAALDAGARVVLYEKNPVWGKKLRITGKGRCNVTNDCTPDEILKNAARNSKFLYSAVYGFTPADVIAFFEGAGVPLKTERGRRVFPVSDRAADIAEALVEKVRMARTVRTRIEGLCLRDGVCVGVRDASGEHTHGAVILATGGLSYPGTGSTGDGYKMARDAGIGISDLSPSLVPVVCRENTSALMGLSLKNVRLSVIYGGKCIWSEQGEMLFTHFGVSGPLVLSASAHMQKGSVGDYGLEIDLKPALDEATLDARLVSDLTKYRARDFINSLYDLLPQKLCADVVARSGIDGRKKSGEVSRGERHKLLSVLKHYALTPSAFRSFDEAIITRGGIRTDEIYPATMMSRKVKNLFFAGEIIDVDAYTGGYNLQIAWSTGAAAGKAAAKSVSGS